MNPADKWLEVKRALQPRINAAPTAQMFVFRGQNLGDHEVIRETKGCKHQSSFIIKIKRPAKRPTGRRSPTKRQDIAFKSGQRVLYRDAETVTVVHAHFDDPDETYYTVKFADGSERQTISRWLKVIEEAVQDKKGAEEEEDMTEPLPNKFSKPLPHGKGEYIVVEHGRIPYYVPVDTERDTVGWVKILLAPVLGTFDALLIDFITAIHAPPPYTAFRLQVSP